MEISNQKDRSKNIITTRWNDEPLVKSILWFPLLSFFRPFPQTPLYRKGFLFSEVLGKSVCWNLEVRLDCVRTLPALWSRLWCGFLSRIEEQFIAFFQCAFIMSKERSPLWICVLKIYIMILWILLEASMLFFFEDSYAWSCGSVSHSHSKRKIGMIFWRKVSRGNSSGLLDVILDTKHWLDRDWFELLWNLDAWWSKPFFC